jgi:biotin transport system substrate-specific component
MTTLAPTTAYSLIRPKAWWMEVPVLLTFNLLLVACAYVSISLPFSPVPITGQTFGVLLVAMALGRVRGTAVVTAYLVEGLVGLPVFAEGKAGLAVFLGPTGGYLLGFVAAAALVGVLADRGWDKNLKLSLAAMALGTVVVFISGLSWLIRFVPTSMLLSTGLTPFLPGAVLKLALASIILPSLWRFLRR